MSRERSHKRKRKREAAHEPRKVPRRAASRQVTEALVEATERVLGEVGYEKATTNRIAEVAGVSVGSLYQYFSSKQGLLAELGSRQHARALAVMHAVLAEQRDAPLDEALHAVITGLLGERAGDMRVRQVLLERLPREWHRESRIAIEAEAERTVQAELERRGLQVAPTTGFIVVQAVQAVIEASVWRDPRQIDSEALADELSLMLRQYLRARSAGA